MLFHVWCNSGGVTGMGCELGGCSLFGAGKGEWLELRLRHSVVQQRSHKTLCCAVGDD